MARVLIIDDEVVPYDPGEDMLPGYMAYYEQALRDAGHDVRAVDNVREGIRLVSTNEFDLVIIDIMMPPGNHFSLEETDSGLRTGFAVAKEIHHLRPTSQIIFLSNAEPAEIEIKPLREFGRNGIGTRIYCKQRMTPFGLVAVVTSELEET